MQLPAPLAAVARAVSWHRRGLAALLAGMAVLLLYGTLRPSPADDVTVLTATRAVTSGQSLDAGTLTTARVPRGLVPQEALTDPDQAVGRVATAGLTAGTILTAPDVLLPGRAGAGSVVVPVRIADADVAALLHPGDRIDLFASGVGAQDLPGGDAKLATGAVVVTVAQPAAGPVSGLGATTTDGALALVRVPSSVAGRIARASSAPVTVVFG